MRYPKVLIITALFCLPTMRYSLSYGQVADPVPQTVVPLLNPQAAVQGPSTMSYKYEGILESQDASQLAILKRSGLHRDGSQIPALMESLHQPVHPMFPYAAMHSLAQLGAVQALSAFDRYLPNNNRADSELGNFADVSRARLVAEDGSRIFTGRKQAEVKVQRFFRELNLTPKDLNDRPLMGYNGPTAAAGTFFATSEPPTRTREGFAVRELADMVYQGDYRDYSSLPEVSQVNFSRDYCSALKMRLAPLSRPDRLRIMISELSHLIVLKDDATYEIQLAINEGLPASRAAAAELQKMDKHREQYNQVSHHSGFSAMFQIIWGVGDQEQATLVERFMTDSDDWVADDAGIVYRDVKKGIPRQPIWAY